MGRKHRRQQQAEDNGLRREMEPIGPDVRLTLRTPERHNSISLISSFSQPKMYPTTYFYVRQWILPVNSEKGNCERRESGLMSTKKNLEQGDWTTYNCENSHRHRSSFSGRHSTDGQKQETQSLSGHSLPAFASVFVQEASGWQNRNCVVRRSPL
jgi:hypothetical protein